MLSSAPQQGRRLFLNAVVVESGRLVTDLSATPHCSDGCSSHEPMRRLFTLVLCVVPLT